MDILEGLITPIEIIFDISNGNGDSSGGDSGGGTSGPGPSIT